jgi:hypothetical protein
MTRPIDETPTNIVVQIGISQALDERKNKVKYGLKS